MMIGELAASLHVTPKTLRLYEERGLISAPARAENGYRYYGQDAVRQARLIVGLRIMGLSLATITDLIDRTGSGHADLRREVAGLLSKRLGELSEEIAVRQGHMDELDARYLALMETPKDAPGDCVCRALNVDCSCVDETVLIRSAKRPVRQHGSRSLPKSGRQIRPEDQTA